MGNGERKGNVKRSFLLVSLGSLLSLSSLAAPGDAPLFSSPYVGAAGAIALPQGGSDGRRLGGATLRAGAYASDFVAFEGEASWLESSAALGVAALVHAQAWTAYGDLFGYSAFDPFAVVGARGWIGPDGDGQVGPRVGIGAFYHLDDNWSLRADADATLGLDTSAEMVYTVAVGVQFAF